MKTGTWRFLISCWPAISTWLDDWIERFIKL